MNLAFENRKAMPSDGEAILNALPNPVILIGPDGKIVDANIAAESFFEISNQFLQAAVVEGIDAVRQSAAGADRPGPDEG